MNRAWGTMKNATLPSTASTIARYAGALTLIYAFFLVQETSAGQLAPYTGQDPPPPAFTLKALDGTPHRLDDYRGKAVLVNFWASWCPPCLAELPSMQRLADRMAPEAFELLAINVGESPFRVSKFVKLIGIKLKVLLDSEGEIFRTWGGTVYPTSFIQDGDGQIRYVAYGPLEWDSEEVMQILRSLLPPRQALSE